MDDQEIGLLVDEEHAVVSLENPDLDPDLDWEEIREMALNRISDKLKRDSQQPHTVA